MAKIESEELFKTTASNNIRTVSEFIEQLKVDFARHTFERLQDIVSDQLRAQAGFMNDYINDKLVQVFRSMVDLKEQNFDDTVKNATDALVARIRTASDEQELNRFLNIYQDAVTDHRLLMFNFDDLIYEYTRGLRNLLLSKFDYMYSRNLENVIDDICGESKSYLVNYINSVENDLYQTINKVNRSFEDAIKQYVEASKRFGETDISFTPGFDEYTFKFNGDTVVYRYDGNDLNAYVNGNKLNNSYALEGINRTIQEKFNEDKFPGVSRVTDAMLRRISEMRMDNQINPDDPFGPLISKKEETSPSEKAFRDKPLRGDILDNPDILNDDYENALPGNVLDDDFDYEAYKKREEIKRLSSMLDIKDDEEPKRELTAEEKEALAKAMETLEIKDDEPTFEVSQEEIDEMLYPTTEHVNPNASNDPSDLTLTPEEIQALLGDLEPKEEVKQEVTEPPKDEISRLQERLDYLLKTPEVIEYLEIQEYLESINKYKDEIAKSEELEPTIKLV